MFKRLFQIFFVILLLVSCTSKQTGKQISTVYTYIHSQVTTQWQAGRQTTTTTGGSWKKSPQRISWMPPKGCWLPSSFLAWSWYSPSSQNSARCTILRNVFSSSSSPGVRTVHLLRTALAIRFSITSPPPPPGLEYEQSISSEQR